MMSSGWSSFPQQRLLTESWRAYLNEEVGVDPDMEALTAELELLVPELVQLDPALFDKLTKSKQLNEITPGLSLPSWWRSIKLTLNDASRMQWMAQNKPDFGKKLNRIAVIMQDIETGVAGAEDKFIKELNASGIGGKAVGFVTKALTKIMTDIISSKLVASARQATTPANR